MIVSNSRLLNIRGSLLDLTTPCVMGILNVTPDSFYDGNRYTTDREILAQTEKLLTEGAKIIDIGGYSSRPRADDITVEEELNRSVNAIKIMVKEFPTAILSIDTFRAAVAQEAVQEGASIINDISGGEGDPEMFKTIARLGVPYILMHMRGTPQTMTGLTDYQNLVHEISEYFQQKIFVLRNLGVCDIIVDPGFGFAKTVEQNFELLNAFNYFRHFGLPLLVGLSRKSMIWKTLNTTPENALNGTTALNMVALLNGASILRVHDVKEAVEAVTLFSKLQNP